MQRKICLAVFPVFLCTLFLPFITSILIAQTPKPVLTPDEQSTLDQIKTLRAIPDSQRGRRITELALRVRALPADKVKVNLATGLASLSTEGDFGHDPLQAVAETLSQALTQTPLPEGKNGPAYPYVELAKLVRYEHVSAALNDPAFAKAQAQLVEQEAELQKIDFTLSDLTGKSWTLSSLRGKVVLVNFWATWCPPCRKEMPDLDKLSKRYSSKGLVVLSISDEDASRLNPYIATNKITYPILMDPGRKVTESFHVDGIPKSFIFDREGKLVTQSIDMRTMNQFLAMLSQAGLQE
jgi:peroxiredoxin